MVCRNFTSRLTNLRCASVHQEHKENVQLLSFVSDWSCDHLWFRLLVQVVIRPTQPEYLTVHNTWNLRSTLHHCCSQVDMIQERSIQFLNPKFENESLSITGSRSERNPINHYSSRIFGSAPKSTLNSWEVIVHFLLQLRTIVTLCKAVQHVSTFAESWIMQNSHISHHFILTFAAPNLNRREFVQNLRLRSLYQHALWPPNAGQNTQDYKFSFRNQLSIKFIFEVSWRTQWKLNKHDKNPMKTWSMISSHVTCSYMHLQLIINKMS